MGDESGVVKKQLNLNQVEDVVDDIILNKLDKTSGDNLGDNESNVEENDSDSGDSSDDDNDTTEDHDSNDNDVIVDSNSNDDEESEKEENTENVDYNSFRVVELKKMCADKELTNYSSLKKKELVELLTSQQ